MTLFSSQLDRTTFYVLYGVWIASIIAERLVLARSRQNKATVRSDRGSALLIYVSIFVSITIAFVSASVEIMILPHWVFYFGLVMIAVGIVVREWAVVTLRDFFSFTVQIREGHRVVRNGPYRFVRHPAYSGSMLTIIGVGVALRSFVGIVVLIVLFTLAFTYRITVEERLLVEQLGQPYAEYMRSTKRLIPILL